MKDQEVCKLCRGHYKLADEHVRGIRYEPVPGSGEKIFLCWECAIALGKVINRQMESMSYTFLFMVGEHKYE
jgi:hypothetical protein